MRIRRTVDGIVGKEYETMSYSRWGSRGSGHWYTYWHVQDKETENRDTAVFDICAVATFTAKQLRDDMDGCMAEVRKRDDAGDLNELRQYATEFLADVDRKYPSNTTNKASSEAR